MSVNDDWSGMPGIIRDPTVKIPDEYPEGTTASRCTGCGEVRVHIPGFTIDEWRKHFEYCPAESEETDTG